MAADIYYIIYVSICCTVIKISLIYITSIRISYFLSYKYQHLHQIAYLYSKLLSLSLNKTELFFPSIFSLWAIKASISTKTTYFFLDFVFNKLFYFINIFFWLLFHMSGFTGLRSLSYGYRCVFLTGGCRSDWRWCRRRSSEPSGTPRDHSLSRSSVSAPAECF